MINLKLKVALTIFSIMMTMQLMAQSFLQELAPKNSVPASPEATSITRFVDTPIDYKSGSVGIEIPLFELINEDIKIPISLKHSGSGIKVQEMASPAGLGWSLHAGGTITCVVNGREGSGAYFNTGTQMTNYFSTNSDQFKHANEADPDVYSFSFLDKSGKFVLTNSNTAISVPRSDLQIRKNETPDSTFRIFDSQGNTYYFNEKEVQRTESTCPRGDWVKPSEDINSSFYLSSVISAKGRKVEFKYLTYSYSYYNGVDQSRSIAPDNYIPLPGTSFPSPSICWTKTNILVGKVIDEIISDNGYKIKFTYSSSRGDLPTPNNLGRLEKVDIYFSDKLAKSFSLTHQYFACSSAIINSAPSDFYANNHRGDQRLLLTKVQQTGFEPYEFQYHLEFNPSRFNYAIDHWGYFNGKTQNKSWLSYDINFMSGVDREPSETHMKVFSLKKIIFPTKGCREFEFEPHKREIVLPTHANTTFLFKEDQASSEGTNTTVKTISVPALARPTSVKIFYSTNSPITEALVPTQGQPFSRTIISWTDSSGPHSTVFTGFGSEDVHQQPLVPGISYTISIETSGSVNNTPVKTDVRIVWMEEIFQSLATNRTVLFSGGLRIKSIKDYSAQQLTIHKSVKYPLSSDSIIYRSPQPWHYTYVRNESSAPVAIYRRSSSSMIPLTPPTYNFIIEYQWAGSIPNGKTEYYFDGVAGQVHYTPGSTLFAETDNSWLTGNLIKTIKYKSLGNGAFEPVEKHEYLYKTNGNTADFYVDNFQPHEFHSYGIKSTLVLPEVGTQPAVYAFEVFKLWGAFKYLEKEWITHYSNLSTSMTEQNVSQYNPNTMTLSKKINYSHKTTFVEYKRVSDVVASSGSTIALMQAAGITSLPIEVRKFAINLSTGNILLDGAYLVYNSITDNLGRTSYLPHAIHALEVLTPYSMTFDYLNGSSFTNVNGIQPELSGFYKLKSSFVYDRRRNLTDVLAVDQPVQSYKFDSFDRIISQTNNALSGNTYYQNFESPALGSLTCANVPKPKGGNRHFCNSSYTIPTTDFNPSLPQALQMSYWYWMNGDWKFSGLIPYTNQIQAPAQALAIDEIKVYPTTAQMTTFSHENGWGLNDQADPNSIYQYYKFDSFGILKSILDEKGNVEKTFKVNQKVNTSPGF